MPDQPSQLTCETAADALKVAAIVGAIKKPMADAAKKKLRPGMSQKVDVRLRIKARVRKGDDVPGMKGEADADVDLCNVPAIVEVVRGLGVSPAEFKRKLVAVGKKQNKGTLDEEAGEDLMNAWAEAHASLRKTLPKVVKTVGKKVGRVNVDVDSIEIL